jgi:acyl transferase domain-containing protein
VTGELYPMGPDVVPAMLDLLAAQVASPVQFVSGLRRLHAEGARVFVEVGPKRALQGFASDVLGDDDVLNLFTNHPKLDDPAAFNQALCGLFAAGLGAARAEAGAARIDAPAAAAAPLSATTPGTAAAHVRLPEETSMPATPAGPLDDRTYLELGRMFADFLDRSRSMVGGGGEGAGPRPW